MENIIYDDYTYDNLFQFDDDKLLKYSEQSVNSWEKLRSKNLEFVNSPILVGELNSYEKEKYHQCQSKIILPFLKDYSTLYDNTITKNMNTEEILLLLKNNLLFLKKLHENSVCHGDITSKNIMLNSNLDIKFIDLCQSIIDDNISYSNIYFNDKISLYEKEKFTKENDKEDLLGMFLYYLDRNTFPENVCYNIELDKLCLPKNIYDEVSSYCNLLQRPSEGYYFIDIIDELIKVGYESPNKVYNKYKNKVYDYLKK